MAEMQRQRGERQREFQERHGYPAAKVPEMWVGQRVALRVMAPIVSDQLGILEVVGVLEAITAEGYVLSLGENQAVVYHPKHAVVRVELRYGNPGSAEDV